MAYYHISRLDAIKYYYMMITDIVDFIHAVLQILKGSRKTNAAC